MKDEISISMAARLLGLDRRTISRVVERLKPARKERGNPLFKLSDVVRAIIAGQQQAGVDVTLAEAKRRRAVAEAIIAEAEVRRIEGTTIKIAEVAAVLGEQCSVIRGKFLGLATRVAPRVAGQDVQGAHATIYTETCTILSELTCDAEAALRADEGKSAEPTGDDGGGSK